MPHGQKNDGSLAGESTQRALPRPAGSVLNATRVIVIALALTAVAVMIWRVSDALLIAFGGLVLGAGLRALATLARRWTGCSNGVGLAAVVTALVLLTGLIGWFFGREIAQQTSELEEAVPQQLHRIADWLRHWEAGRLLVNSLRQGAGEAKMLAQVGLAASAALNAGFNGMFIVFLGIYFAADPDLYVTGVLRLIPPVRRPRVRRALNDAGEALRSWLLAQIIAMVVIGVVVGVCLTVLGVPLAFLLGGLAGLLEFVPVAGPILFALPGILMALSKSPELALSTTITYLVVQQLESNVLIPLLQRWAVRLPPVVSLLAVVAGGLLLGPMGIVFAAPLAVVGMVLVKHLYVEDTLEHHREAPSRVRHSAGIKS